MADRLVSDCQAATVEASISWGGRTPGRVHHTSRGRGAAGWTKRPRSGRSYWKHPTKAGCRSPRSFTSGRSAPCALQRLHFEQKALAAELTETTGAVYRDALGMDESIAIVQPYAQMAADESIHARARAAITTLRERRRRVTETVAALRRYHPADARDP